MRLTVSCSSLVLVACLTGAALAARQTDGGKPYGYYYKGQFIELNCSADKIALVESAASRQAARAAGLQRDILSDEPALAGRGLAIYRTPVPTKGRTPVSLDASIASVVAAGATVQPVFEQGPGILVPIDEVVVGFPEGTPLAQAEALLGSYTAAQGITAVRDHGPGTFIATIANPGNGRGFEVAQFLAGVKGVVFAEPCFAVLMVGQQPRSMATGETQFTPLDPALKQLAPAPATPAPDAPAAAPVWTTLASVDFESATFPPTGWTIQTYTNVGWANAYWGRTAYRSHGGAYSTYCVLSGTQGVTPPGPVPINSQTDLNTPLYNLTGYKEVYIEVWFYAKNDLYPDPGGILYDYPVLYVVNNSTGSGTGVYLASFAAGDCTTDPTAASGWRKCVFRVPPAYLVANAYFKFRYISDNTDQYEGAYLDDVRVVGATNVDTQPLHNDRYGARIYELQNVGQVAGLGNDTNDLHCPAAWTIARAGTNVLAIVDEGVDLGHPDLNLVTGYDYDGTGDGRARGSHGTACAGNAGAISNNTLGVIGTAPGVRIMPIYTGAVWPTSYAQAIDTAVAKGAKILSNSWGINGVSEIVIENAIRRALASNRVVVCAAANGPDRSPWNYNVAFPGSLTATSDVICVGATGLMDDYKGVASSDGAYGWGSSYVGAGPDVCAPAPWSYTTDWRGTNGYNAGGGITNSDDGNYTHSFSGTSSSTPKVAGIVALLLSAQPGLTPGQVKQILKDTSDDVWPAGVDDRTGAGRVNAYKALASVGLQVTRFTNATGTRSAMTFPTGSQEPYALGSRSNLLAGAWSSPTPYATTPAGALVTAPIVGTGSNVTVYVEPPAAPRFYRVEVLPYASSTTTTLYANTTFSGQAYLPGPTNEALDYGSSAGGSVTSFTMGYATRLASPGTITVRFYTGTTNNHRGALLAGWNVSGLAGSGSGALSAFRATIDLGAASSFVLPPGPFGYSYVFANTNSGFMLSSGGAGNEDLFWLNNSLVWFGGTPFAGLDMSLNATTATSTLAPPGTPVPSGGSPAAAPSARSPTALKPEAAPPLVTVGSPDGDGGAPVIRPLGAGP